MKTYPLVFALMVAATSLALSGCAVFSKGKTQTVVVRSSPSGAVTKINGTEVGRTPFQVDLGRAEVYRLDFSKPGFSPQSTLLLPSSTEYDKRFLRWGVDYALGAASDLLPGELSVELKPQLGEVSLGDRFEEMTAQINRADAMLAANQLTVSDHRYLVSQITASYYPAQ